MSNLESLKIFVKTHWPFVHTIYVTLRDRFRNSQELSTRKNVKIKRLSGLQPFMKIEIGGNFYSDTGQILIRAFNNAMVGNSKLSDEIRNIPGMSGQTYRSFINCLVEQVKDARYLEIGSWAGSTASAAMFGNAAKVSCVDNWSQFGGPKDSFFSNVELAKNANIEFEFREDDFRDIDYNRIGKFNIYMFDGPHEFQDQYDGIFLVQQALDERYILIVDDWNWWQVRKGTFRALADTSSAIECFIELHTTLDNTSPPESNSMGKSEWHNGYFMAVIEKSNHE